MTCLLSGGKKIHSLPLAARVCVQQLGEERAIRKTQERKRSSSSTVVLARFSSS
ncbi:hypothetical protein DAI22_09g038600 [Oryza sativa Japonica Group]|nr:hypothetical protein DAI22_09g038600 [Oryza sativa Japonica Group]